MALAIAASSETSQAKPRPAAVSPERDSPATDQPSATSALAIAAPMPRLAPVMTMIPSRIAEFRRTLVDERGDALPRVRRPIGERREIGFDLQSVVQRHGQRALHGLAGEAQHRQAVAGESAREGNTGLNRIALNDAADQADALRLGGVDRASGQDHVERSRLADDARQPLRAAVARDQAELDFRQRHLGIG